MAFLRITLEWATLNLANKWVLISHFELLDTACKAFTHQFIALTEDGLPPGLPGIVHESALFVRCFYPTTSFTNPLDIPWANEVSRILLTTYTILAKKTFEMTYNFLVMDFDCSCTEGLYIDFLRHQIKATLCNEMQFHEVIYVIKCNLMRLDAIVCHCMYYVVVCN